MVTMVLYNNVFKHDYTPSTTMVLYNNVFKHDYIHLVGTFNYIVCMHVK